MGFVEDSFKELDELEKEQLLSDERVRQVLISNSDQYGTITYDGVSYRFKAFIDKKLRHKMMKIKLNMESMSDESSLNATERAIYELLGDLCVDPPFNSWKTWALIDEKKGIAQSVFMKIMAEIGRLSTDVKSFR